MQKRFIYTSFILSRLAVLLAFSVDFIYAESESTEDLNFPTNRNLSVEYQLYTPENSLKPCFIKPLASIFDNCAFNSSYETKFLIHGFYAKLKPGNYFEKIKDSLLEYNKYNVIIVNWTKYNTLPDVLTKAKFVGDDVAVMINFLTSHTGVKAESVHIIGHSLGAQLAGVAGKNVINLGRITGLDPDGLISSESPDVDRLTATDALFVDAIHTSNSSDAGLGMYDPIGWANFYPNGGEFQPMCAIGNSYTTSDGELYKIHLPIDLLFCNHDASLLYFLQSISECEYLSTECGSYSSYEKGQCESSSFVKDKMGFHCLKLPEIQKNSIFFLNTSSSSPHC